jgi:hypothetical protein
MDKSLTYYSIHNLQKANPSADYLSAEKNPQAKWFMTKFGLLWGNVLYGILSIIIFYICIYVIQGTLQLFRVANYVGISWYVMFLVYSWTIGNNLYFVLKNGRVLP